LTVEVPDDGYHRRLISCQDACPVRTDARGYVRAVAEGRFEQAYLIARGPNPFASICVVFPFFETHRPEGLQSPFGALLPPHARVEQGEFHVPESGVSREQVEDLKDEADLPVAEPGELFLREPGNRHALDPVRSGRRNVQAAEDVHQGGFPGP